MEFKQFCLIILLAITSLSFNNARADSEIHSRVSPGFIRITDYADYSFGFQLCRDKAGKNCAQIGSRKSYSAEELNFRSKRLRHEGYILLADDAGWLVVGTATAVAAVVFMPAATATAPMIYVVAGSTAVSSIVGILHGWLIPGNAATPLARFNEAKTLDVATLIESNHAYLSIPIEDYAKKLDTALADAY